MMAQLILISTELLNVAYRVPSEGAYSIFPIRVVGFTDSVSQELCYLHCKYLVLTLILINIFFAKEFFFDKKRKLIIQKLKSMEK